MSRFFVGQRVRIVWARRRSLTGRQGVVTEIMGPLPDGETGELRLGYGLDISPIERVGTQWLTFSEDQLEPILYDGAAPSEYSYTELMDKCREGVAA